MNLILPAVQLLLTAGPQGVYHVVGELLRHGSGKTLERNPSPSAGPQIVIGLADDKGRSSVSGEGSDAATCKI